MALCVTLSETPTLTLFGYLVFCFVFVFVAVVLFIETIAIDMPTTRTLLLAKPAENSTSL